MSTLGNLWHSFSALLPKDTLTRATVISSLGSGRYHVQYLGGSDAIVTSDATYTAGQKVFLLNDTIKSVAPSLTSVTLDV